MAKLQFIEYGSNSDLPSSLQKVIPEEHAQSIFRAALNSHLRDGKTEMHAYIKAYRALEDCGYARDEAGKYVYKEATVNDVHVNRPLGAIPVKPRGQEVELDDPGTQDVHVEQPAAPVILPVEFEKRISGGSEIPLNAAGKQLADQLGKRIQLKGGLDVLHSSPLQRAQQTAQGIARHNPEMKLADPNPQLQPWRLGEIEGQQGGEAKNRIAYFIEHADEVPPGKGADEKPAESFRQGTERQLDFWKRVIEDGKDEPTAKIGVVAHSRGVELLKAWVDAGCPEDYRDLDAKDLLRPDDPAHASMLRLHKDAIDEVKLDQDDPLKPGIYVILHSLTDDDGDKGNADLEKRYLPPVEVHKAAAEAYGAGITVIDITQFLAEGTGLDEPGIRKVAEHFAAGLKEPGDSSNAWGGPLAAKWAERVIRKIESRRVEKAGSGAMVAFWPDAETAKTLAVPGGEKPEEIHLTLAYLGKQLDMQKVPALEAALDQFARSHGPVTGEISGPGRFDATAHSDGKDVAYAAFGSPGIQEFHAELVKNIEETGFIVSKNFGYTPHLTLAYISPGADSPVSAIAKIPVTFSKLTLSIGGSRKEYPLTGEVSKAADEGDHWVTINGNRVLLGADGQVKGGSPMGRAGFDFKPTDRVLRAMKSYSGGDAKAQRIAEEQERIVSNAIGLPRTKDNSAFDMRNAKVGVELKTMQESRNAKITMSKAAMARKVAEIKADKLRAYTVVADKRAGGTVYYVKQGVGSFRVNSMTRTTLAEIREMIHQ